MIARFLPGLAMLSLVLATSVVLAACGGGSEPEHRPFDLTIKDRKLDLDPAVVKVKQDDTVTLSIRSDESGRFHLHGYDIEKDVGPDETTVMEFTANATGDFRITFHPGTAGEEREEEEQHEEEGEELPIGSLEVHPR